jgi:hypothetical protein
VHVWYDLQAAEKLVLAEGSKMIMVGLQSAYNQAGALHRAHSSDIAQSERAQTPWGNRV